MQVTLLEEYEEFMVSRFESLKHAARDVIDEARVQIKAAELAGNEAKTKDMLVRHTRAVKVLRALQKLEEL